MEAKNQALPHMVPASSLKPLAVFIVILILAFTLLSDGYASDEQFSMQIQDKTLAAVFQELTRMSGQPIAFDKQWANQPINTRFANLSLEMAIAKILKNLNHVVIFEEDKIQIKIYGVVTPDEEIGRASTAPRYIDETVTPYKINPSETSFPIDSGQKDTSEDESDSEEGDDPKTSDEDTENSEEADEVGQTEETMQAEDMEGTNEEKTTGELKEADESEAISPENS